MEREMSPAAKELFELEKESSNRLNAKDFEWFEDKLKPAEYVRYSFDGEPTILGAEAAGENVGKRMEDPNFEWRYCPVWTEVSADGNLGYAWGTLTEKSSTMPLRTGKYVTTWRKIDGKWHETNLMTNFDD